MTLVVRAGQPAGRLLEDIRAMVSSVDADAAVDNLGPLETKLAASVATPRAIMLLLLGFSGLALALAVAGLYGVLSHMVTTRSRELGIRAALGARRGTLVGMVVRQGLGVTIVGLLAGMAAAAMVVRVLQSQLFGVQPLDPVSFFVAPALLIVAALAACVLPARRAAAADPASTLRAPSS
jgi:ABC-type antimicrobial peptide transport system permease subunit